jgi:DNA-directed RNA polymerase subunit F
MIQKIELIQSNYHPEEALEILGNLIQQKIAYHTQKTIRHQEMFGTTDAHAEQRLSELQEIKKTLIQELKQLEPNTLLHINGHVSISVVAQQQAS